MKNFAAKPFLIFALMAIFTSVAASVERYALVIGKNNGGDQRKVLKYAHRDAALYRDVLMELGGLDQKHTITLTEPSLELVEQAIFDISNRLQSADKKARKEFFFYYSGHSDELGLLLDQQRFNYKDLKKQLDAIKADVSVVVLDSCSSGNFTALKGGKRMAPFINPSSTSLKGKVFLASSSSNEFAQESDKIKGSFFTHNLVSAMRGAADHHPDGKITLNEAYQYAYSETLMQTESSLAGTQHPSYSIQLVGNGELVMTDINEASSQLTFNPDLDGLIYVRDSRQQLIAEVRKFSGKNLAIAVIPGKYLVGLSSNRHYSTANVQVAQNQKLELQSTHFTASSADYHQSKGQEDDSRPVDVVNVDFSLTPDLGTYQYEEERRSLHHFSLSLLYSRFEMLQGASISMGANIVDEYMQGAQLSMVGNMSKGDMEGAQFAHGINYVQHAAVGTQISGIANYAGEANHLYQFSGIANHLASGGRGAQVAAISNTSFGDLKGAQLAAISNITTAKVTGAQIALFNKAKEVRGAQLGIVNIADEVDGASIGVFNYIKKNGEIALGYRYDDLGFHSLYFRSGTNNFYTIFQGAHDSQFDSFGGGIGGKFSLGVVELGLEYTGLSLKPDYFHQTEAVTLSKMALLVNPYKTKYINFIAGVSYNHLTSRDDTALEAFNRYRENSSNAWIGYQLGLEWRF